jgi:hypothetical protein
MISKHPWTEDGDNDINYILHTWGEDNVYAAIEGLDLLQENEFGKLTVKLFPKESSYWYTLAERRERAVKKRDWVQWLGHVIPTRDLIDTIACCLPFSTRVISIGCGVGLWEYLLSCQNDFRVTATDINKQDWCFMPIEHKSASDIDWNKNRYDCLMMVWPFPSQGVHGYDYHALDRFRGKYVVYIGFREDMNDMHYRVASRAFRQKLRSTKHWTCLGDWALPSSPSRGYYPTLYLYERVKAKSQRNRNVTFNSFSSATRSEYHAKKWTVHPQRTRNRTMQSRSGSKKRVQGPRVKGGPTRGVGGGKFKGSRR